MALTNHPEDEILVVTLDTGEDEQEGNTLDINKDNGDNNSKQLNTDTMGITPEHPVYVEGKGWIWAEILSIGDCLRRADGGMAKVLAIERVTLDTPESVYNFTVKGPHTYFVLDAGVLVHNARCQLLQPGKDIEAPQLRSPGQNDIVLPDGQIIRSDVNPSRIGPEQRHQPLVRGEVYPPERLGVDPNMEGTIMKSFPVGQDRLLGLRDRPVGTAALDGRIGLDAKHGGVQDWMILQKYSQGRRELIDVNKVLRGEYEHVSRAQGGGTLKLGIAECLYLMNSS